jgi:hypothetical protein
MMHNGSIPAQCSNEFNAGYLAHVPFLDGILIKNPYPFGTQGYLDWRDGFHVAVIEFTRKKVKPLWVACGFCQACQIGYPKMCMQPNPA